MKHRRVCRTCVACELPRRNLRWASLVQVHLVTAFDIGTDEVSISSGDMCPWCRDWLPLLVRYDRAWTVAEALELKGGFRKFMESDSKE